MFDALESWLRLSAQRLHDQAAALTALDQAIGDGDHGINMDRGFTAIVASLDAGIAEAETDLLRAGGMLRTAGRTLISTVGGAAGPLYGTAFMRAGGAIAGRGSVDCVRRRSSWRRWRPRSAGSSRSARRRPARRRCSTRWCRRVTPVVRPLAGGADVATSRARWPTPPRQGALATVPMLATKGRASYLGERSIGHQDPGATSSALLLRALADVVAAG